MTLGKRGPMLLLAAAVATASCVDPLASDEVPPRDIVFDWDPATSHVMTPREYAESAVDVEGVGHEIANEIAEYDGIDEEDHVLYRLSGFSGGARVWYWKFGPAPPRVAPMWVLVNPFAEGESPTFVDHPAIWDQAPGDAAYSPFWRIYFVTVTDRYQGERLLSRRAVDEAMELGLVGPPQPSDRYVNCPVVDEDARLQVRPGSLPRAVEEPCPDEDEGTCVQPYWAYYRGLRVAYFDVNGGRTFDTHAFLTEADRYELRRETEALPLSEPARGVDITGDEDDVDTNDVFPATPCDDDYTPIHRTTEVFVGADYSSIDTAQDETQAGARQVSDLFAANGDPRAGVVVGVERTQVVENLAMENPAECP